MGWERSEVFNRITRTLRSLNSIGILVIKLGATGDVVRTTSLLRRFNGPVTWLTEAKNVILLRNLRKNLDCFSWEEREVVLKRTYELVINLEDSIEVAEFCRKVTGCQWFGAYADSEGKLRYTTDSSQWFDLSLISVHGREGADLLKLRNRRTYQEMIFEGLAFCFDGEKYLLPEPIDAGLSGDVAIAAEAGAVWPMKQWAYYKELKQKFQDEGFTANMLPTRRSLLEHLGDVRNHRCLVSGDSLPMHFALGTRTPCVTLFTCTSPWEIYDYDVQKKIVSPLLAEFFYKRGYDERATTAISVDEVFEAVMSQLSLSRSPGSQLRQDEHDNSRT